MNKITVYICLKKEEFLHTHMLKQQFCSFWIFIDTIFFSEPLMPNIEDLGFALDKPVLKLDK